jgi:hypothetical protein
MGCGDMLKQSQPMARSKRAANRWQGNSAPPPRAWREPCARVRATWRRTVAADTATRYRVRGVP